MQTTGKFRNKKATFTAASNVMLFDARLDMDTKTLHNMINYYISIPGFTLYKGHLQKETGYLVQHKLKGERGIFYYEYELFDVPQIDETVDSDKQVPDKQEEEGTTQNILAHEKGSQVRNQQASPTKAGQTKVSGQVQPVALKAPLEEAALAETVDAQRGDFINKTLENKTINNNTLSNQKYKQQQDIKKASVVVADYNDLNVCDLEIRLAYQRAFGMKPAPQVSEQLMILLRRFEKTVLLYAIETAGNKGKGFDYAQGILKRLEEYKAYTMNEVFEYEQRYSNRRMG